MILKETIKRCKEGVWGIECEQLLEWLEELQERRENHRRAMLALKQSVCLDKDNTNIPELCCSFDKRTAAGRIK
jgi:hypothetical protein